LGTDSRTTWNTRLEFIPIEGEEDEARIGWQIFAIKDYMRIRCQPGPSRNLCDTVLFLSKNRTTLSGFRRPTIQLLQEEKRQPLISTLNLRSVSAFVSDVQTVSGSRSLFDSETSGDIFGVKSQPHKMASITISRQSTDHRWALSVTRPVVESSKNDKSS